MYAYDTTVFCIDSTQDVACDMFNGALKELFTWCINNRLTPHPGKCEVLLPFKTRLMGPLPAIYIGESIIEYKTKTRFLGVTVNQNLSWVGFYPGMCATRDLKVIQPSITYAMPVWGSVSQTESFKSLERQHRRAARIIFGFPSDMPTADVLTTVKWDTLKHQYIRAPSNFFL